jgi:hypothetical protein
MLLDIHFFLIENGRLPKLEGVPDVPTDEQNMNPTKFKDHFSKPRRVATRKEEIMRLRVAMRNKELDCIEQYLSRCKNDNIKKIH